MHVV
ncbi:hypothetical protein ECEC1863_1452, partial [Escherichia coli EC1863]|jgi:6-phosphogluconolactonase (cycloisomerase 2 family)